MRVATGLNYGEHSARSLVTRPPRKVLLLKFSVKTLLVVAVDDLVLVLQQPVDRRRPAHGLADRGVHGFAVGSKEVVEVEIGRLDNFWIEPNGGNDADLVDLVP